MSTSKPVSPERRIQRLEDQLRKRLRFDWLVLILGFLLGVIFTAIISAPPVWLGQM